MSRYATGKIGVGLWTLGCFLFTAILFCQVAWAGERLCVTSKIANVRSGPGTNQEILWKVETFYPIIVLEKKGSWYKFKDFEGDMGWIHKSIVGKVRSVITVKDNCNVRSGAGPKHAIVFPPVEKGVPFKVLQEKGNWFQVEHGDGDRGWIYKTLVW
ncbi:MAG: SH3 domain-containing protein [Desulfobacterium sp.]|nr:SH3 domain-containing protein [Desulfobacterium sp.]